MIPSWSAYRSVILIADASSSAAFCWAQITATITHLVQELPIGVVKRVYLLGSNVSWSSESFLTAVPPRPAIGHSFAAPVIAQLQLEQRYVELAIVIGSGPIFDLADWLPSPWIGQWLLAPVGEEPMAPAGVTAPSLPAAQLLAEPPGWSQLPDPPPPPTPFSSITSNDYQWEVDDYGFPLIYLPPLQAFWSLFPVTWPQLEQYTWTTQAGDDQWVAEIQPAGNRLSFRHGPWPVYERLLATRLQPEEAAAVARWAGGALPTIQQWRTAYCWLQEQPALLPPGRLVQKLSLAARHIWQGLFRQCQPDTLAALSLMGQGVYEWVQGEEGYRLLGKTRPLFHQTIVDPMHGEPIKPIDLTQRIGHHGMRIIRT